MSDELERVTKKNRQPIYISDALRKILARRKEPLSKVVSIIAERYLGAIERGGGVDNYCIAWGMYKDVIAEVGRPLTPNEIATFAAMCKDWLARNPNEPQGPNKTAILILEKSDYLTLLKLVDRIEEQLYETERKERDGVREKD